MLNSDLMSGASLEALAMLLVSSYAIAESALGERLFGGLSEVGAAIAVASFAPTPVAAGGQSSAGATALRRAEALRSRGLSRCLSRARVRSVIRIRGRR